MNYQNHTVTVCVIDGLKISNAILCLMRYNSVYTILLIFNCHLCFNGNQLWMDTKNQNIPQIQQIS